MAPNREQGSLVLTLLLVFACANPAPPTTGPAATTPLAHRPPMAQLSVASEGSAPAASSVSSASSVSPASPASSPPAPNTDAFPPPAGMRFVPGGTFTMGSEKGGEEDEKPAHAVIVAAFFLDETEVTNEAYGTCVTAGRCRVPEPRNAKANHFGDDRNFRRPGQPVSAISWDDSAAYCVSLERRLPTEAEWERAARGDDNRRYPWGNEPPTREHAVFGESVTSDVGSRPAGRGPYGHLDLAGNVWEWTADFYDPYAYRRPTATAGTPGDCPQILEALAELRREGRNGFTGTNAIPNECERVLRGGAFNYDGPGLRASNRVHHPGRFRLVMSGFRCAKSVPDQRSRQ